jgi:hypothetical protein
VKSRAIIAGSTGLIGSNLAKSRLAGFHVYQPTLSSFLDLFARLREERIIV